MILITVPRRTDGLLALKRGGTIEEMVLKYLRDSSKHPDDHVNKGHNKNSKK